MMNMSIACDVTECKYHDKLEKYCTLNAIHVTRDKSHTQNQKGYADCASFEEAQS